MPFDGLERLVADVVLHAAGVMYSCFFKMPIARLNIFVRHMCRSKMYCARSRPLSVSVIAPTLSTVMYSCFFKMPIARLTEGFE